MCHFVSDIAAVAEIFNQEKKYKKYATKFCTTEFSLKKTLLQHKFKSLNPDAMQYDEMHWHFVIQMFAHKNVSRQKYEMSFSLSLPLAWRKKSPEKRGRVSKRASDR